MELALGSLVFVTVLLFGIHFAEIAVVKLSVQRAASNALWDTTAKRLHRNRESAGPAIYELGTSKNTDTTATNRYADFEPTGTAGAGLTLALTRASNLQVTCRDQAVATPPPPPAGDAAQGRARLATVFSFPTSAAGATVDGMGCTASAEVEPFRIPDTFLEGASGGFFGALHVVKPKIRVCAYGRRWNGVCSARVPIALDDWGFAGSTGPGRESASCDRTCNDFKASGNQAYRRSVERLYQVYRADYTTTFQSIDQFVMEITGVSPVPVDERDFRFVFIGEDPPTGTPGMEPFHSKTREPPFQNNGTPNVPIDYAWPTSPWSKPYKDAYGKRGQCFLGTECDKSLFGQP